MVEPEPESEILFCVSTDLVNVLLGKVGVQYVYIVFLACM